MENRYITWAGVTNNHGKVYPQIEELSIDSKESLKRVCTHKAIYFYDT